MNRTYLLYGFLATLFLPVCIQAAEYHPEKENKEMISVVTINNYPDEPKATTPITNYLNKIIGDKFEYVSIDVNDAYENDLTRSEYIIVVAFSIDLESLLSSIPEFIAKNPNKLLILFRDRNALRIEINDAIKALFNNNVFIMDYTVKDKHYTELWSPRNESSVKLVNHFLSKALRKQKVAAPIALPRNQEPEPVAIPGSLQQALDPFIVALSAANQQVEVLRNENLRLNLQVADAIKENQRLNLMLSEITRRLAEQGL